MQILTWNDSSKDGALQVNTRFSDYPYSDSINVKPLLSFDYKDLYYNECDGRFLVDGIDMTEVQKAEIQAIFRKIVPPLDWVKFIKSLPYDTYMRETGWYIERLNDPSSGKAVPEDVLTKRAICREQLSLIKECTTIEQLEQLGGVII